MYPFSMELDSVRWKKSRSFFLSRSHTNSTVTHDRPPENLGKIEKNQQQQANHKHNTPPVFIVFDAELTETKTKDRLIKSYAI